MTVMTRAASEINVLAASLGVHVACHRAGRRTRFRFFDRPADYFSGGGLGTVLGPREALTWLRGYEAATRSVSLERREAS